MKTKKASASTLAIRNKQQTEPYHQTFEESKEIFREFIGFLLLRLAAGQTEPTSWQVFDQFLRQLYEGGVL